MARKFGNSYLSKKGPLVGASDLAAKEEVALLLLSVSGNGVSDGLSRAFED